MRLLISFFLCFSALFAKEKVDFLFYVQDAGETNALLPVIDSLEGRGYRIAVFAGGVAEELMEKRDFWTFPDLGADPVSKQWRRDKKFEESVLLRLFEEIEPKVIVTGVAFAAQGQVLDLYRGLPTFAFWDNFNSNGENPYFRTARSVAFRASTLLLPAREIEADFKGAFKTRVVGHPTIEEWREQMKAFEEGKTALFIGGYGKEYEEAFALFVKCVETSRDMQFLVLPHPKTSGSFEKALLATRPELPIRLVEGMTAIEAVGRANLVLCHQSTVAFQALACGKRVIHVIPEHQSFDSLPLKKALAAQIHSPEEFQAVLMAPAPSLEAFDQIMGIPANSVERLSKTLIEAIPHKQNQWQEEHSPEASSEEQAAISVAISIRMPFKSRT